MISTGEPALTHWVASWTHPGGEFHVPGERRLVGVVEFEIVGAAGTVATDSACSRLARFRSIGPMRSDAYGRSDAQAAVHRVRVKVACKK